MTIKPPSDLAAPGSIEDLIVRFAATDFEAFCGLFQKLLNNAPSQGTRAALRYLAEHDLGPAERFMISCLSRDSNCFAELFDPLVLSLAQARRVAALMMECDAMFLLNADHAVAEGDVKSTPSLARALDVLGVVEDGNRLIPLLRRLSYHSDERIRSKAVMSLCRLRPSRALVKRQLESIDPRIRASAIEALWNSNGAEAVSIFREALNDIHHRVVANAVLGLHHCKDKSALEIALKLAEHESPAFRAAIAWVLGQMGDARALPALETLAKDSGPSVRRNAVRALLSFRRKGETPQAVS